MVVVELKPDGYLGYHFCDAMMNGAMLLVINSVSIYEYVILMYFNVFNVCVCVTTFIQLQELLNFGITNKGSRETNFRFKSLKYTFFSCGWLAIAGTD